MKKKIINNIICSVFDNFTNSIKDQKVRELVKENSVITGGSIASMLLDEKVNDYDIYFTDSETAKAVSEYYVKKFNRKHGCSAKVVDEDDVRGDRRISIFIQGTGYAKAEKKIKEYAPAYLTSNAITLEGDIQLIIRFYGDPEEIHANYDFVHCTNYWSSDERDVFLNKDALEALITKELRYMGSRYPLASIIRSRKFIQRGWHINAGQYLKMVLQLHKIDLSDEKTLCDQLTGIDIHHFTAMLGSVPDAKIGDNDYLFSIIDKFF